MPAHHVDTRRSASRFVKMKIWKDADATRCATCQQPLSAYLIKDGVRRCRSCRKAAPGRPVKPPEGPGTRTDRPDWLTVKSKAVAPSATESWWLLPKYQGWEAFSARAKQLDPRRHNAISLSPGGHRD